jgi:hypothetical protein
MTVFTLLLFLLQSPADAGEWSNGRVRVEASYWRKRRDVIAHRPAAAR